MNCSPRLIHPAALLALLALTGCSSLPTFQSIKYGYAANQVSAQSEPKTANDYNDVASGWAPEPVAAGNLASPVLYGRDGSPVSAPVPGGVTTTSKPLNDGVADSAAQGGSRSLLLDLYGDTVEERDALLDANEDLQRALDMSETRANSLATELGELRARFDALGKEKQSADTRAFDLAARLSTAQIARLEAERALLEATLEWRRMSANNNSPLSGLDAEAP